MDSRKELDSLREAFGLPPLKREFSKLFTGDNTMTTPTTEGPSDAAIAQCPNGLLPDGEVCPRCGGHRGPSGADGGSWVHCPAPKEGALVVGENGWIDPTTRSDTSLVDCTLQVYSRSIRYGTKGQHLAAMALRDEILRRLSTRTPPAQGGGGEGVTLPMIVWAMRNWASVADTCAVTEGHAPACIRTWADQLEALTTQQQARGEPVGYVDADELRSFQTSKYRTTTLRNAKATGDVPLYTTPPAKPAWNYRNTVPHDCKNPEAPCDHPSHAPPTPTHSAHGGSGEGSITTEELQRRMAAGEKYTTRDYVVNPEPPTSASDAEVEAATAAVIAESTNHPHGESPGDGWRRIARTALQAAALARMDAMVEDVSREYSLLRGWELRDWNNPACSKAREDIKGDMRTALTAALSQQASP